MNNSHTKNSNIRWRIMENEIIYIYIYIMMTG